MTYHSIIFSNYLLFLLEDSPQPGVSGLISKLPSWLPTSPGFSFHSWKKPTSIIWKKASRRAGGGVGKGVARFQRVLVCNDSFKIFIDNTTQITTDGRRVKEHLHRLRQADLQEERAHRHRRRGRGERRLGGRALPREDV